MFEVEDYIAIFSVILAVILWCYVWLKGGYNYVTPIVCRKDYEEKVADFQLNLHKKLKDFATTHNIPVYIKEELDDCAGQFISWRNKYTGRYLDNEPKEIRILNTYEKCPWVLGHELGHYLAIKRFEDRSEERADAEGRHLVLGFLDEEEKEYLEFSMGFHLPELAESS